MKEIILLCVSEGFCMFNFSHYAGVTILDDFLLNNLVNICEQATRFIQFPRPIVRVGGRCSLSPV